MILLNIKVHGICATKVFTNVNTDAPVLHAATPFHPVFARVLWCGRHLLWPTSSSKRCAFAFSEKGCWLAQVTGFPMWALVGLGKVSGLRWQVTSMLDDVTGPLWGRHKGWGSAHANRQKQSLVCSKNRGSPSLICNDMVCKPSTWWRY